MGGTAGDHLTGPPGGLLVGCPGLELSGQWDYLRLLSSLAGEVGRQPHLLQPQRTQRAQLQTAPAENQSALSRGTEG